MAADNEVRLLSRAIRTRDITPLLEAGVEDNWFFVDENKQVWRFLRQHWTKYAEVPTAVTVKDNFPAYRLLAVEDSAEYLLDQLIEYRKRQSIIEVVQTSAEAIAGGDHNAALAVMNQGIARIADNGPGLTDADQARIFERFYRADASRVRTDGEGTGLGLSIVDAVMRAHAGQVSVESEVGKGAVFTLFFPLGS